MSVASRLRRCLWLAIPIAGFAATASAAAAADTTPPTITASVTPAANARGWHRTSVTVRFTCADTESGIAVCPAAVVVKTEGAHQVVSGTARDKAGNTAMASVTLNIDKIAPVVTASRSPEAPTEVSPPSTKAMIAGTVTDGGSGVVLLADNEAIRIRGRRPLLRHSDHHLARLRAVVK